MISLVKVMQGSPPMQMGNSFHTLPIHNKIDGIDFLIYNV